MKDITTDLAIKNGLANERYIELVRKGAKEICPNTNDEFAILRKETAYLREVIETIIGKKLPPSEFTDYNEKIERAKVEAKAETGV